MRHMVAGCAFGAAILGLTLYSATPLVNTEGSAATASKGKSSVGVLFASGDDAHVCTASVVHSATHNVIVTAAHCLSGDATDMTFTPGYSVGEEPYGRWSVQGVYVDPTWAQANPNADVAMLTLKPQTIKGKNVNVEDVTGSLLLGDAPKHEQPVTIMGYNEGTYDGAIACTTRSYRTYTFPTFTCDGFSSGTSGSPWMTTRAGKTYISGLIGGYHEGGCSSTTSYSPVFGAQEQKILQRAEAGAKPDTLPDNPPGDGCDGDDIT